MTPPSTEVTQLLLAWSERDQSALDQLAPLVYEELRRLAHEYMRRENPGHTLQTAALVQVSRSQEFFTIFLSRPEDI